MTYNILPLQTVFVLLFLCLHISMVWFPKFLLFHYYILRFTILLTLFIFIKILKNFKDFQWLSFYFVFSFSCFNLNATGTKNLYWDWEYFWVFIIYGYLNKKLYLIPKMTSILFQCKIIGKPLNGYISSPQMVINEALEKKNSRHR